MKIKFIKDKGCCKIGYVATYPEARAKLLIESGVAVEYKEPVKKKKGKTKTKLINKEVNNNE